MHGRFIALEGTDGVGKTSLAQHLADLSYDDAVAMLRQPSNGAQRQISRRVTFVSRRQISATSQFSANLMQQLSTMLWHSGDAMDLSDTFWISLQAAWFTAHTETVTRPLLEAGFDVIVDGWLYKFYAKLLIQGRTERELDTIFANVLMPDTVILLQADTGAIFDRRRDFRLTELGMHAGYDTLSRETFVDYQTKTASNLRHFARRYGWHIVDLDPHESIAASTGRLAPVLAQSVERAQRTPAIANAGHAR